MYLIIFIVSVIFLFYHIFIKPFQYWKKKGITYTPLKWVIKDHITFLLQREAMNDRISKFYNYAPDKRYYGGYQFFKPIITLRDPEVIKQITVKDFDHFVDHQTFIPEDIDPLWARNLFALTGEKWKDMRSTLSPVFTSSKIKQMFILMRENAEQFTAFYLKQDENIQNFEAKDVFTRFTNDVIANTVFGLKCDSLEERDNQFYLNGKASLSLNGFWRRLTIILMIMSPKLTRLLNLRFFQKEVSDFFIKLVADTIKNREETGVVRPDLIHILMEARKHGLEVDDDQETNKKVHKLELSDIDITAQALIFFFAGFDSVASLMCFMAYELALNPDIQEKLYNEIIDLAEKIDGNPEFEHIQKMKYMEMVISETLRKWPNAVAVDRICTKAYTLKATEPNEKDVLIDKGVAVVIPIYGLHHDSEYFSDPERFDPERFSEENRTHIRSGTYIPFGYGPRNCIGSRFALIETKILFYNILKHFEIITTEKTEIPLKLSKLQFNLNAENGIWLGLKKRKVL